MLSICAVIAVRNEAQYLRVLLPILAGQGIEVAILDNESTDGSQELYTEFSRNTVIRVEQIPYRGYFSLTEQLEAKNKLYMELKHNWLIHQDADEILEHVKPGRTLRDAIEEADARGYDALNFDEFTFLPEAGADHRDRDYYKEILRYYFYEPAQNRLNRAWRRVSSPNNVSSGGHRLAGDQVVLFPTNQILRHYIVLGYEHAKSKYLNRSFDPTDINRGWHGGNYGNRLHFTKDNLRIPTKSEFLFQLDSYDSKEFCKDLPSSQHFWGWSTKIAATDLSTLEADETRLLAEPWYHNFEVLGLKTPQREGIYAPNQRSKQLPLFKLIDRAISLCKDQKKTLKGVELFCADGFYSNYAIQHGASSMYGLDIDTHEIAKAQLITKLLANSDRARFEAKNVFDLKDKFDFGICAGGLYHLSNPADLLTSLTKKVNGPLVIQTVFSMAQSSATYFETPAPGWTWGCRFSYDYLLKMVEASGWTIVHAEKNELKGNDRPEDRGSAYLLCIPAHSSQAKIAPHELENRLCMNPNQYAPSPRLELNSDRALVTGYQQFSMYRGQLIPSANDSKLGKKRDLLRYFFESGNMRDRTVLDLGASGGYFCFWAAEVGAKHVTAVDMDEQYVHLMKELGQWLGAQNLLVEQSNAESWKESADIVIALAIVHWIYSCTALLGSLDAVVGLLRSLTRYALIVEWVDPKDEAIQFFHHLDWNPEFAEGPYDLRTFEAALSKHFLRVDRIGEVSDSRILYVAYATNEINLSTPYPLLYKPETVISSRRLASYEGIDYWCTVYDTGKTIVKQATLDLATREYDLLSVLPSPQFPSVIEAHSEENFSVVTLKKIEGSHLQDALPTLHASVDSFYDFVLGCLNILYDLKARGIMHRDIRIENIMLQGIKPILIDFGWAISEQNPYFTPPALGNIGRPPDGSFSDVYSMGKVLERANQHYFSAFDAVISLMATTDSSLRITDLNILKTLFAVARNVPKRLEMAKGILPTQLLNKEDIPADADGLQSAINQLLEQIVKRDRKLARLIAENQLLKNQCQIHEQVMAESEQAMRTFTSQLTEKEQAIESLTTQLTEILSSKAWSVLLFLRKIREKSFPHSSRRDKLLRAAISFAYHATRQSGKDPNGGK